MAGFGRHRPSEWPGRGVSVTPEAGRGGHSWLTPVMTRIGHGQAGQHDGFAGSRPDDATPAPIRLRRAQSARERRGRIGPDSNLSPAYRRTARPSISFAWRSGHACAGNWRRRQGRRQGPLRPKNRMRPAVSGAGRSRSIRREKHSGPTAFHRFLLEAQENHAPGARRTVL